MTGVRIGIHVHAEPERLRATLESIRLHTAGQLELLLLPDGPDAATLAYLATLTEFEQLGTTQPQGAAACFNRLAKRSNADVIVLLESGAIVSPHWLERLLAALDADRSHGLAGPSTNRSWNEQGGHATAAAVEHLASTYRTLEPLHSLADFCYVVKREVIQAIGLADEGYGLGPCWEMDYNIRAARAGFKGIWACGAYVYRSPFTQRRQQTEMAGFAASKRRYQDKFCGLRLTATQARPYEPHCRGDACEHFAPAALIQVQLAPIAAGVMPKTAYPARADSPTLSPQSSVLSPVSQPLPLISCIMPTSGRPDFALKAVEYFLRQDYANRELIIVDDQGSDLEQRLPRSTDQIQYTQIPSTASIGAKRNRACEMARGSIIAQWDDDDWYAPHRLSVQAAPLLQGRADVTGLEAGIFFDLDQWRFWRCTPQLHQRLFVGDVHGGTLVYKRQVWQHSARYPDLSIAEDAAFLMQAMRKGARLQKIANPDAYIYLRHGRNAWTFNAGEYLDPRGWQLVDEPVFLAEDRAFYAARSSKGSKLVSCIMPTYNRRRYVSRAIRYFQRQTYLNCELVILDDGDDAVGDLVPEDPRIRYTRINERMILGAKRNLACDIARGDIIAHWDDDDWIAPTRLTAQVALLENTGADLCGAARQLYYQPSGDRAWLYEYPVAHHRWVAGNTLCYRKPHWQRNPFPDIQVGEDTRFVWSPHARNIAIDSDITLYVGLVHENNTSPKSLSGPFWQPHPVSEVHHLLGDDLEFYACNVAA